jgi:hypothetical protein
MVWKDKWDADMLMNMHQFPAEGNFCDEHGNTLKWTIIRDYNRHVQYVDKSDSMINIPSADRPGSGKKIFFSYWT